MIKSFIIGLVGKWATTEMVERLLKAIVKSTKNPFDDSLLDLYVALKEKDAEKLVKTMNKLISDWKAKK